MFTWEEHNEEKSFSKAYHLEQNKIEHFWREQNRKEWTNCSCFVLGIFPLLRKYLFFICIESHNLPVDDKEQGEKHNKEQGDNVHVRGT